MSMAYHPQMDGETECVNQELKAYFRMYCRNNPIRWEPLIAILELIHNNHMHETTKQTLFFLMGEYEMKPFPLLFLEIIVLSVKQQLIRLQKAREEALVAHKLAQQKVSE